MKNNDYYESRELILAPFTCKDGRVMDIRLVSDENKIVYIDCYNVDPESEDFFYYDIKTCNMIAGRPRAGKRPTVPDDLKAHCIKLAARSKKLNVFS